LGIQTDETYQPQYLSAEVYQAMISDDAGTGGNVRGNGNDRRGGQP
jgi:hypothetical protein